jgi:hypothetical protein
MFLQFSAHGVRKIAATTAANNGATTSQLKALFGWTSDAMPTLYTRAADRERLGREAGHMLGCRSSGLLSGPHTRDDSLPLLWMGPALSGL